MAATDVNFLLASRSELLTDLELHPSRGPLSPSTIEAVGWTSLKHLILLDFDNHESSSEAAVSGALASVLRQTTNLAELSIVTSMLDQELWQTIGDLSAWADFTLTILVLRSCFFLQNLKYFGPSRNSI